MKKYILIFFIILFSFLFLSACSFIIFPTTFTVTYNGNGNTGGSVPIDSNSYARGTTIKIFGNTGNLARTGYSFAGWNTKSDGTGESYIVDDIYIITSNTTLYAEWVSNNVVDAPSLMKYLKANFGILQTSIGQTKFEFDYYENTTITSPYDYWIQVGYDIDFFHDLKYSNQISTEMNHTVCQELKDHQERIARAAIDKMPNKKIQGGYFSSCYLYPYIHEGYVDDNYYSWRNYCGTTATEYRLAYDHYPFVYENAPITGFGWTAYIDDDLER